MTELAIFSRLTKDLGVTHGTIIIVMILSYFIIKWAVKNAIKEAYSDITGKQTAEEAKMRELMGLEKEDEV